MYGAVSAHELPCTLCLEKKETLEAMGCAVHTNVCILNGD